MPSAPSSDRSRVPRGRQESWPTVGTSLFTGDDLESAVASAVAELGADIEVKAARSVKQGLRGRTHVEVLVAGGAQPEAPPVLPPSERWAEPVTAPDADPVESTLAALLAAADAEEEALQVPRGGRAAVERFDPPPFGDHPSFAAEFAAAFPAALAAARATDDQPRADRERPALPSGAPPAVAADFTARVREALRRVPEEQDDIVDAEPVDPEPVGSGDLLDAHPALDLLDAPTDPLPVTPAASSAFAATPFPRTSTGPRVDKARPEQTSPLEHGRIQDRNRPQPGVTVHRPRPTPGPAGLAGRPSALVPGRPATAAWSRVRLRAIGVPERVLNALPVDDPQDDLRWLVALTDAIAATVPAPVATDDDVDVTADGRGLAGALALLRLGVDGITPHLLTVDGRALPATATELALAVRAGLLR